ncbi:NADP/FAD dependent oxidoreductase [Plectosphaerella plurivora]|uniref:NADPH--cytochrome P450 reductase n=1 Tax=Plectosphaerella plurivora TaxID=936078 RepID=A0A9P9A9Y3_9PEZI|nr:NADP/FAD dependent oxidoreductase [Plectosphaerella plurivora]
MEPSLQRTSIFAEVTGTLAPQGIADAITMAAVVLVSAAFLLRDFTWDRPDPYRHLWFERPQDNGGSNQRKQHTTRNIAQKLEELKKDAVVFWGSQSGTAEGLGARLGRELQQRFHLDTFVADLSDFDPETIVSIPRHKLVIFVLATYGDGDPSDNATDFFDWLQRQAKQQSEDHPSQLGSLRYAAFGLGNSHYQFYNRIVDVVDGALQHLGAERLVDIGKADDALGSTEEDYISWKERLYSHLVSDLGLGEHDVKYEPVVSIVPDDSLEPVDLYIDEPIHSSDSSSSTKKSTPSTAIKDLPIRTARQLCSFGDPAAPAATGGCLHIDLDLANHPQLRYKTGDHLAIWPTNPEIEVDRLLSVLGSSDQKKRHRPLLIKSLDMTVKVKVPTPTTLYALLRHHLEICAPVPRDIVLRLGEFAPSTSARKYLLGIGRSKDAYTDFTSVTHVTFGRLLEHALAVEPSTEKVYWSGLPLSFILETLPRLQPRYYSISSSSVVSPRVPSITVGISNTRLETGTLSPIEIPGLATSLLNGKALSLQHGNASVFAHIRQSKFRLPALPSTPLLMVAAGTGLAPFRAFIEERLRLKSIGAGGNSKPIGQMMLIFGCQSPEKDYLYRDEIEDMQRQLSGKLKIVTAFSRALSVLGQKTYVQHRIREHADEVAALLLDNANFYVCGRASMAREAGKAVNDAVALSKNWDGQQIREWAEGLKRNRKWQEDVWG